MPEADSLAHAGRAEHRDCCSVWICFVYLRLSSSPQRVNVAT
jgi:hypothetical protein